LIAEYVSAQPIQPHGLVHATSAFIEKMLSRAQHDGWDSYGQPSGSGCIVLPYLRQQEKANTDKKREYEFDK
jgi:hypothetical protein